MIPPIATAPPDDLLAIFRAAERKEAVAVFVTEDGFDAATVHVLAAWQTTDHVWVEPRDKRPESSEPTAAAWRWLVSGWQIDYAAVAIAADVSFAMARAKMDMLVRSRLVYPDGKMAAAARGTLQSVISAAVRGKKKQGDEASKKAQAAAAEANKKTSEAN